MKQTSASIRRSQGTERGQRDIVARPRHEGRAFRKMRRFLMNVKGLSEDEAIALMSASVDFGVTQVVDGNWGVHAILSKRLFENVPRS
jgi:acetamidase/formamidase